MANVKRKMKTEREHLADAWAFDGKLGALHELIKIWIEQYGEDAYLDYDCGWDGPGEYTIVYERLETEKEAEKRVRDARRAREKRKADKLKQEEKERKELARLLKKYGEE